ncbi:hypothetical protein SAMD00019534_083920 [Acytostelium subglobosum LB1]|uniref:hypothetical protein n=1 Tax=Acytostelium subglobosum LB1 TaxID=1410327 RepID=UPI0006448B73|nr:hypothetical protein SAMD00019534_083920 [Acytostelium subglobosum LB1]GAM25217.1 hypothetical protein SAMD00019534_083920 [Acytostelium subglobosum LB1]|eukprot:XP_012751737.1 hypothetical protein SAMD00019534_083920 [Acytostelium subglobosum LB1]
MQTILNNYQLLRYIVSKLDSNIDRLCLSFTCKHLYTIRERYLRLEQSSPFKVNADHLLDYSAHTLRSYESLLTSSVSNVRCVCDASMIVLEIAPSYCTTIDYSYHFKLTCDMSKIPNNIHTLIVRHTQCNRLGELPTSITRLKLDMDGYFMLRLAGEALTNLNLRYNVRLPPHCIPSSVITLKLTCPEVHLGDIPHSVTRLTLSVGRLSVGVIPPSVTHLRCTGCLDDQLSSEGVIPDSVTTLYFRELVLTKGSYLPTSITSLTFDKVHGIGLLPLPSSVTDLTFGDKFNRVILQPIPASVRTLRFGEAFNQSLEGMLPSSLIHLQIANSFYSQQLTRQTIPSSVISLHLGFRVSTLVHGFIPGSVTTLYLDSQYLRLGPGLILPSVTSLTLFGESIVNRLVAGIIPASVTSLSFECYVKFHHDATCSAIPATTTSLRLGSNYYLKGREFDFIPPTITSLDLDDDDIDVLSQLQSLKVVSNYFDKETSFDTIVWIFKATALTSISFAIKPVAWIDNNRIFHHLVFRKLDKHHALFLSDFRFSGFLSLRLDT